MKDHPWFIGVQYHPELKSKPFEPHPLFKSFIDAAKKDTKMNKVVKLNNFEFSNYDKLNLIAGLMCT